MYRYTVAGSLFFPRGLPYVSSVPRVFFLACPYLHCLTLASCFHKSSSPSSHASSFFVVRKLLVGLIRYEPVFLAAVLSSAGFYLELLFVTSVNKNNFAPVCPPGIAFVSRTNILSLADA